MQNLRGRTWNRFFIEHPRGTTTSTGGIFTEDHGGSLENGCPTPRDTPTTTTTRRGCGLRGEGGKATTTRAWEGKRKHKQCACTIPHGTTRTTTTTQTHFFWRGVGPEQQHARGGGGTKHKPASPITPPHPTTTTTTQTHFFWGWGGPRTTTCRRGGGTEHKPASSTTPPGTWQQQLQLRPNCLGGGGRGTTTTTTRTRGGKATDKQAACTTPPLERQQQQLRPFFLKGRGARNNNKSHTRRKSNTQTTSLHHPPAGATTTTTTTQTVFFWGGAEQQQQLAHEEEKQNTNKQPSPVCPLATARTRRTSTNFFGGRGENNKNFAGQKQTKPREGACPWPPPPDSGKTNNNNDEDDTNLEGMYLYRDRVAMYLQHIWTMCVPDSARNVFTYAQMSAGYPSWQEEVPVSPPSVASAFFLHGQRHIGSKRRAPNCVQEAAKTVRKTGVGNATGWLCRSLDLNIWLAGVAWRGSQANLAVKDCIAMEGKHWNFRMDALSLFWIGSQ